MSRTTRPICRCRGCHGPLSGELGIGVRATFPWASAGVAHGACDTRSGVAPEAFDAEWPIAIVGYGMQMAVENSPPDYPRQQVDTSVSTTDPLASTSSGQQGSSVKYIRLQPGERILMEMLPSKWWTWAFYVCSVGLWGIWRKRHRYILTNQRIVLTKGLISKSVRALPLDRIQDANLHTSPFSGGRVKLSTAGGILGTESIKQLTRRDAKAFIDLLSPLISRGSGQGV